MAETKRAVRTGPTGERRSARNPFTDDVFFTVPTALYETGLSSRMRHSQFVRYITLCRLGNYRCSTEVRISLAELERLDGVSKRAARDANTKLQEYGLILFERTNPHTYRLVQSFDWNDVGPIRPRFRPGPLRVEKRWHNSE